jgi:hypothetical protein
MVVFYDYWHLDGLDGPRKTQGTTPWERIMPKLIAATGIDKWLWHNFVCFIKDTRKSTDRVSPDALAYSLDYFLELMDLQQPKLVGVTNLDVLNLLRQQAHLPPVAKFRDAAFSEPFEYRGAKVFALYHPGTNGQLNCLNAHRKLRLVMTTEDKGDLLVSYWRKRLCNV